MTKGEDDVWLERKELIWIPVISAIVGAALFFTWLNYPALAFQADATITSAASGGFLAAGTVPAAGTDDGSELNLRSKDIPYLNRIYRETTHEQAYCGLLEGDKISVWKADTVNSSLTGVWYETANCPKVVGFGDEIRIHTQPNSLKMSETDKATHRSNNLLYSCIQNGLLTDEAGQELASFACYQETDGEFERLDVEAGDGS